MFLNDNLVRETTSLSLGATGVIGSAASTVDTVSCTAITATAAGLNFTLPNPADLRRGNAFIVINAGTNAFTMYGQRIAQAQYCEFIFDTAADGWQSPSLPTASAADFWRSGTLTGLTPDGATDVQDAIFRSGQVAIDTGTTGDSGLTLDDLRSTYVSTSNQNTTTENQNTATGVNAAGKVVLANSVGVPDVRATNLVPQDYGPGVGYTFKTASAIGILPAQFPGVQTYVNLETNRRYGNTTDLSGGPVVQRVTLDDGRKIYRNSTSPTAWGPWQYETQVQTEFNLQDLLRLNGTAKVSTTGEVSWTNRFITMTAGATPQESSGYHDITLPAVGATIPVQGGGTRTVVAPTGTSALATGGIQLNAWETLWYRAVRGTGNGTVAGNFLITTYTVNATTGVPGLLNGTSYPGTHAGEWVHIVHRDDANVFHWGTKDTCGLGGQFGSGMDVTIAQYTAFKQRAHFDGYAFATFAATVPTRVGITGTIRWIDAGQQPYSNIQGYIDSNPAGRVGGTVIAGVNGAAARTWETVTAADAITKFGGARTGVSPIAATSTVVQLAGDETLYYVPNLPGSNPVDGGTWVVSGYAGAVTIPVHWLPVYSYQTYGANSTTQVLVGGVRRALRSGEAVWFGSNDGDIDRLHRRMGVSHAGLKYTRFTQANFFAGAGANGTTSGTDGVLVSWDVNTMMYGISDGYASWGNQYTYINPPAVGTAIPVATTNGAVTLTRVVQNISGRAYIPLGNWESLWFIPAAYAGGTSSQAGDFVVASYATGNHMVPPGAVRVAHYSTAAGADGIGIGKTRVLWADGEYSQPGVSLAVAGFIAQNDTAQGSGDWRPVTVAGGTVAQRTGPGMSAPMTAVAGVVGPYAAPYNPEYRYLTTERDPRGQIEIAGLISLNNNVASGSVIAFMAGVQVRGAPIVMAQLSRSTLGAEKDIPVQIRFSSVTINGQAGTQITVQGGLLATNVYATLGANGAASAAGTPQWLSIGPTILPHA